jgi:hypothetical protein
MLIWIFRVALVISLRTETGRGSLVNTVMSFWVAQNERKFWDI